MNQIVASAPPGNGGNKYSDPTAAALVKLSEGIQLVAGGSYTSGKARLGEAGYYACWTSPDLPGGSGTRIIYHRDGLSPSTSRGRSAMMYHNPSDTQPDTRIVLSVPHVNEDVVPIALEAYVAKQTDTAAVVVAGTHRCNHTTNSLDNANTTDCGGHYKISDMAHRWDTASPNNPPAALSDFQVMHDELRKRKPAAYLLQLHGMSSEPGFSISDSYGQVAFSGDTVARAHSAYRAALLSVIPAEQTVERSNLTTCQGYGSAPAVDRKCGEKNDQAEREITSRPFAGGHPDGWLHLEMSSYIRENHPHVIQQVFSAIRAG
ncbi:hypothetical protein E1218_08535 [Kribbella turkmenica]|uniref:Uncharacterized protein n=1 Tax=Kribbella turkmenica TaxID=2530375 RepID=A0A4R4XBY3_9ACTN|nr:hypothetical protein [Kribbella turkmenica]TDD28074.1 hypothetical protein E1218_08535 [Kribbella turkmenica]